MKALILGGARSGKSGYAESCALSCLANKAGKHKLYYIATGTAGDEEMTGRIAHHQARRDERWELIEEPLELAKTLSILNQPTNIIVLDCLTLWVSNLLCSNNKIVFENEKKSFIDTVASLSCDVFIVSNEVGSGVVPMGQLSREFVDHSGWLHQDLAKLCDTVTLVVAGLPLSLKN